MINNNLYLKIENNTIIGCNSEVVEVIIPNNIEKIDRWGFYFCDLLTNI